jgi:hypothetical protein
MLAYTKLGTALDGRRLHEVEALGDVLDLAPGEILFREGDPGDALYVVLANDLSVQRRGARAAWIGPGDVTGEVGFVLGTPRTGGIRAGANGARVWRLPRRAFTDTASPGRLAVMARIFTGLAPYVRVRIAKIREERSPPTSELADSCDDGHPAVARMAAFLQGGDEWETARAIWEFVRDIPYRIGFWTVRASRVLWLGFGMCTTKSTLQVALMRASGIESAFAEVTCASDSMNALIPAGYHHFLNRKPTMKHYFAVARLRGRWHPLDATFPPIVWRTLHPERAAWDPRPDGAFNPLADMLRRDPYAFDIHSSLAHVMSKRPFYDADSVEAMNIVLDRLQGRPLPPPGWVAHIDRLLPDRPRIAFQHAFAGLSSEMEELHGLLVEAAPGPPPEERAGHAVL